MKVIYNVGIMKRVKKDEMESPKMTAEPRAVQVALERVMGMMPAIVTMEVIKIASKRDLPASMIASSKGMPVLMLRLILSIKMMAFFTTMPKSAKIPISPGKLKVTPRSAMPINTPMRAKGRVTKTIIALRKELN